MKRLSSGGFVNGLALSLVLISLLAIAAIVFGVWAFSGRETYKNNDQVLINNAVAAEKTKEDAALNQQFQIESENPFTSYTGPQQYGSVTISYPKDWSGYVDDSGSDGNPVDGYFEPGVVPAIGSQTSNFALRLQINSASYSSQLSNYTGQQQSGGTNLTITPYSLKKVPSVVGVMIQGDILSNEQGVMVMLPLRTNTLEIWNVSPQYDSMFINQILPTVTFQP